MVGPVDFGALRRVTPISRAFGFERGRPVDRYYIEQFLERHAQDIRGRVVEIGEDVYTRRYGAGRVDLADVLNLSAEFPNVTIVADLTRCEHIPDNTFDCFIFTQTLQFIYDLRAAVASIQRILAPGGVLLSTFPALSQVCRYDMDRWGDYWRFTTASIRNLLSEAFGSENVDVRAHGNILGAVCFLHGLAAEDLTPEELDFFDPDYPLLITGRAVKR
jgi:SAM-dependent methyltransferase